MWILLLIIPSFAFASACHPECHYACDDPVCLAICETVCEAPACEFNQTCGYSPSCSVQCPLDMCESESCPVCETVCAPPPSETCGQILCEATSCSWKCRKPFNCPKPLCELQCEQPACAYSASGTSLEGIFVGWVFLWIIFMIL